MSTTISTISSLEDTLGMKMRIQDKPLAPDVPQEIVDLIVDNLQDDPLSLRACALTSRSWLHRSRRHLHARIRIGEYYINLERYSCPHIAQYVQELDVYMVRTTKGRQRKTTDALWEMIARFPNLSSLIIRDFEFYRLSPQRYNFLRMLCAPLRSLSLHHVHFTDVVEFLSFVGSCKALRTLEITDGQFFGTDSVTQSEEQCRSHLKELRQTGNRLPGDQLRSLSIGSLPSLPFEKMVNAWLGVLSRTNTLRELILSRETPEKCAGALEAVGSSSINLCISKCSSHEKLAQTGIDKCSKLRSLTFITTHLPSLGITVSQAWIVPFLQHVSPPPSSSPSRLHKLTFELHWANKGAVDVDFLTEVDHILSSRQDTFGSMKEVVFVMHRHFSPRLTSSADEQVEFGPLSGGRPLPERTLQFKMFLKRCLGTHLKGVLGRPGCVVLLLFPNDGDVFRVTITGSRQECKH